MSRFEGSVYLAVALTFVALIGFDIMGIMVRLLSDRGFGAPELSAYRNVLGVIPSLVVMAWMRELPVSRAAIRIKRWKLAFFRGFTVAVAQLCFYSALGLLELATVSALAQTNALFVVLISIVLLGERIGSWRMFALALGFIGAVWIMRPGSDTFTLAALFPVGAAFCYAFTIVSVRLFDDGVSNALLYLYSSIASAAGSIILVLFTSGFTAWEMFVPLDWLYIFIMSMSGGIAVLILMLAYRMAAPSVLAPFQYMSILTAFGFGWLIFNEAPIDTLFPGVILIVGAGLLVLWRESRSQ